MPIRGVTPGRGQEPRGPERKKEISRELRSGVDKAKHAVWGLYVNNQSKNAGYSKEVPRTTEERKTNNLSKKMFRPEKS